MTGETQVGRGGENGGSSGSKEEHINFSVNEKSVW